MIRKYETKYVRAFFAIQIPHFFTMRAFPPPRRPASVLAVLLSTLLSPAARIAEGFRPPSGVISDFGRGTSAARTFAEPPQPIPASNLDRVHAVPRGGYRLSLTSLSALSPFAAVSSALTSGSFGQGLGALCAVAASVVVPLTLIRQAYSFSVGYGLSVAAMSAALLLSFPLAPTLTPSCVLPVLSLAYGLRLAGFLLYRQWTVPSKAEQLKTFDKTPKLKRVPLAAAVAGFYALMVSPVLSSLNPVGPVLSETVQWSGVAIAALG